MPQAKEAFEKGPALVDRSAEGRRVVEALAGLRGQIAVLHGRARSGKSEFVRKWVIPALPKDIPVFYGACESDLPESVEGPSGSVPLAGAIRGTGFVILDSFDRLLAATIPSRRQVLAPLFAERSATLVLIASDQSLEDLLALRPLEPAIMDHLIETGEMSLVEGLENVESSPGEQRLSYGPELLAAIEADLETFSPGRRSLTPELVIIIDAHFRDVTSGESGNVDIRHLETIGGLRGILETYVERRLGTAPPELQADNYAVIRAMLEEVVGARAERREFDSAEPARRLAISSTECSSALNWLISEGMVRESRPGLFELAPNHLEQVIAESLEQKRRTTRDARDVLARGLASWNELHVTLPPARFAAIHGVRAELPSSTEEAAFLVYCALRCGGDSAGEQAKYWLGRIAQREQQISAAFVGLFDTDATVRARAAALLEGFDEPEVRGQLYRTAVEDPEQEVRRAALASLSGMRVAEFWEPLARDAQLPSSRYRIAAVEALRLFRDKRAVDLLRRLIADAITPSEIRAKAIETLAAMESAEAAEALVDIALHDGDEDDRTNAAGALALTKTKAVAAVALRAMRHDGGRQSESGKRHPVHLLAQSTSNSVLAVLAGLANLVSHGAALISISRYRTGFAIFGAEIAIGALSLSGRAPSSISLLLFVTMLIGTWIPMKELLDRRSKLRLPLDTFAGTLAIVLYVESTFTTFLLFHGLAHHFSGRTRAAARLFGLEVIGLACLAVYFIDQQTYQLTRVGPFYLAIGSFLFVASWLYDVLRVAIETLIFPGRAIATERKHEAYSRILANPLTAGSMVELAGGSDVGERRWAASVLHRCGDSVPPSLWVDLLKTRGINTPRFVDAALRHARREETISEVQALWTSAEPGLRNRIFQILARDPSERSLDYLGRLWDQFGFLNRLRYYSALLEFRLKLIPGMLWIPAILGLILASTLAWHGWQYTRKPSKLAIEFVSSQAAQDKEPDRVVKFAKFVTETYPTEVDPKLVAGLGRIAGRIDDTRPGVATSAPSETEQNRLDSPTQAARILADLLSSQKGHIAALAREELLNNTGRFAKVLSSPDFRPPLNLENRKIVLGALEALATPPAGELADESKTAKAVETLKTFVMQGAANLASDRVDPQIGTAGNSRRNDLQGLQVEAVRILARIPSAQASSALQDLTSVPGPSGQEAQFQRKQTSSAFVESVRSAYARSEYDRAIDNGTRVLPLLQSDADAKARAELLILRGKARWRLALTANTDTKRADELDSGAVSDLENARQIAALDTDSARVLASCYTRLAERLLPKDLEAPMTPADQNAAMAFITAALDADKTYAEAHGTRATLMWKGGDPDGAIAALAEATRIDPKYAWAFCMQAWISLKQGKYDVAIDYARSAIDADADYSWSYTLLGESYHREDKDRDAIATLDQLRAKYPGNPWPVQTQMYIYHENLSANDKFAYQHNYQLYKELQKKVYASKITKPDDLEAGFVEACLTSGQSAEAISRGTRFLERTKAQPDSRLTLPVRLIVYAARALNVNDGKAPAELNAFEAALKALPKDFTPEWSYQGTLRFVRSSNVDESLKTPVAQLVDAIDKDPLHVPPIVLQANRDALKNRR